MNPETFSDPVVLANIVRFAGLFLTLAGGIFDLGKIDDNVDMVVHGVTEGLWKEADIPEDECMRDGIEVHVFPDIRRKQLLNVLLSFSCFATVLATVTPVDDFAYGVSAGTAVNGLLYAFKLSRIRKRFPSNENSGE